jgi:transcription elongation GreA/GreB family factor
VLSVDWFYKRVDIDFEKKKGHQMSFGYAGETLEIIGEDHLLYALTRRREELMAMVEENPAEVVRMALRSFGPLPIAIVQEHLIPRILAETQWKGFWDSARKVLKKDPLVVIPTRRSEPLCLLASEKAYDDAWFAQLKKERTMERILELVEEYQSEGTDKPDEAQAKIMANRLAFVVKGAGRRQPGLAARAVMLAKEFELPADQLDADAYIRSLLEVGTFLPVVSDIPARDIGRLLQHMKKVESDTCLNMLGENLTAFDISLLNEAMDLLLQEGREDICRAVFRDHTVEQESADVEMLYWLYRNPQWLESWSLGSVSNLARWMLRALEYDHNGEKLKTQNQLRKGFEQEDWLRDVLAVMTAPERRDLFRRIKESTRWETLDRQSLMGRIIKWYPEMQEVLKASIEEEAAPVQQAGRVTSERSYRERQEQLQRIIQEEIPAVAREIAKAREYGDLSENFEYTAAKDKQALLLKRQAELQEMLASVRPVDFAGFSAEAVGMGTEVVLVHAAGQRETYCILGVWDRDEALGIISCESALAKALEGHRAGDEVVVPTEHGEATCLVERVSRVPEEVQNWIVG